MTTKFCNCPTCRGTGFIKEFAHVASGECFHCRGTGKVELASVEGDAVISNHAKKLKNGKTAKFLVFANGGVQVFVLDETGESEETLWFDTKEKAREYWKKA